MKALRFCANGDGNPVCPSSKVICRKCMDKITSDLEDIITDMKNETPYCFRCQSYHPKDQDCLMKRR
jgi:hypothetical protein